jgi:dienelactone hydrolase
MRRFARFLAARGIGGAIMTLPYHMQRLPPGDTPQRHFLNADVDPVVQALSQSASDVSTVAAWLGRQPGVDPQRIGAIGVSLGAIVIHLAMGRDSCLDAGVAILGGGDLAGLRRDSLVFRIRGSSFTDRLDEDEAARLARVDPITWAGNNRPRKVLMIQAARDLVMPPRHALALWEALGRPPIRWVDTNHFAMGLAAAALMRVSAAYLHSVWDTSPSEPARIPAINAPTLKLGLVSGLDAALTPAIQWQAHSFMARSDHMSLLHADLGWSGRGLFLGVAATLTPFLDLGLARRFDGRGIRRYLSFHVVF